MANICVGSSATGSGTGTDWNNQSAMPAITGWVRGNTYYFADGSYSICKVNTANSGSTLITIKKAIESDHGTDTGWSSTLGDGFATFPGVFISKNYIIFDGQTGGGPSAWRTGFGFVVDTSAQTANTAYPAVFLGEATQTSTTNVTVRHVEVIGDGGDGLANNGGQTNDGISSWGGSNNTFEYMYIHDMGRCIIIQLSTSNLLFQYNCTGPFEYHAQEHSEVASLNGGNQTFRYNLFLEVGGTGGLMFNDEGGTGQYYVYGNIFYNPASSLGSYSPGGNGCIGSKDSSEHTNNTHIYNNTYINTSGNDVPFVGFYVPRDAADAYNNIFYGPRADLGDLGSITHDYNYFNGIIGTGATHDQSDSGDPFVNYAAYDFRLNSNTTAGTDLGSPYNVDMLGNTRTTWTRGAIEFATAIPGTITVDALVVDSMTVGA